MSAAYRRAMEALYILCIAIASLALAIMTLVIPYGVFMRYAMNDAASWPEPLGILMMLLFTFTGAAAVYRAQAHIAVHMFVDTMGGLARRLAQGFVHLMMAAIAFFMLWWGASLVGATWNQTVGEFPDLRVGITYLPIPVGGGITLLFLIELLWLGPPGPQSFTHREPLED
jgi:TRAP-type C4-dicarboxylate transport system permease small subunit